jgi:hypothetical protein
MTLGTHCYWEGFSPHSFVVPELHSCVSVLVHHPSHRRVGETIMIRDSIFSVLVITGNRVMLQHLYDGSEPVEMERMHEVYDYDN